MIESSHQPAQPRMEKLNGDALARVAAYFQVLAEPTRLQILNLLREHERNVGELAQLCRYSAANISRHLSLLSQQGFVVRETRGNSAYYRIADASVYELCDMVCGSIARQFERTAVERAAFAAPAPAPAPAVARKPTRAPR